MSANPPIYADANSTTPMPAEVMEAWKRGANHGDPTIGTANKKKTDATLERFQNKVEDLCSMPAGIFRFVFSSGSAEASIMMIESCVSAYASSTKRKPHIVLGALEEEAITQYVDRLVDYGRCQRTYAIVDPKFGVPSAETVQSAIRWNTCLISVSAACGITGALTNLPEISLVCFAPLGKGPDAGKRRIPFHSDLTYLYPRSVTSPETLGVDAFSVSSHKMHGPAFFGFLAIRNSLIEGYGFRAVITGRMLDMASVEATLAAHEFTFARRAEKNRILRTQIKGILTVLKEVFTISRFPRFAMPEDQRPPIHVVVLSPPQERCLPNTLLLGIIYTGRAVKKAEQLQLGLEKEGVLCRAYPYGNAPVLRALHYDGALFSQSIIRISLPDDLPKKCAQRIASGLVKVIKE